ncbi:hypothetical protein MRB53_008579 [Persea americana]|uniref:Uncharacterized protein n=1 Tax=Persea americana TaxID=3435 RepID=A0ACC2MMF6_PERAE|nr:hypothetical protein MRB53_008579 [Persea americana]
MLFASVTQDWKNKHGSDVVARPTREAKRDCFLLWKAEIVSGEDKERITEKTTLAFIFPTLSRRGAGKKGGRHHRVRDRGVARPGALDEEKKSNRFIRRFKRLEDVTGETTPHFRLPLKTFVSLQSPNPTPETLRRPQFAILTETRRRKTQRLWFFFLMDPTMELNLSLHVLILDDVVVSTPDPFSSPIQRWRSKWSRCETFFLLIQRPRSSHTPVPHSMVSSPFLTCSSPREGLRRDDEREKSSSDGGRGTLQPEVWELVISVCSSRSPATRGGAWRGGLRLAKNNRRQ